MDIVNSLNFSEGPFIYTIKYLSTDNILDIKCSHNEEYYVWSKTISDNFLSDQNITKSCVQITLTPLLVFKILEEFVNKTLNNIYSMSFPKNYKTPDTLLVIEITTKMPYLDVMNRINIYLEPMLITEVDRINIKLARLKESLIVPQQNEINTLGSSIRTISETTTQLISNSIADIRSRMANEQYKTRIELNNINEMQTKYLGTFIDSIMKPVIDNMKEMQSKVDSIRTDLNKMKNFSAKEGDDEDNALIGAMHETQSKVDDMCTTMNKISDICTEAIAVEENEHNKLIGAINEISELKKKLLNLEEKLQSKAQITDIKTVIQQERQERNNRHKKPIMNSTVQKK